MHKVNIELLIQTDNLSIKLCAINFMCYYDCGRKTDIKFGAKQNI